MKILYLANGPVGVRVLRWLRHENANIAGVVIHGGENVYGQQIIDESNVPYSRVFYADELRSTATLDYRIAPLQIDLGVSIYFGYILKRPFLDLMPVINLHPSYLPFNKGAYPNVWSIIDGTPAGATLHWVDSGIDTGNIIAQREIVVSSSDTGYTLYKRLEKCAYELFVNTWPIFNQPFSNIPTLPQKGRGTGHLISDVDEIDRIDLDKTYVARDLINLIRARTHPAYPGAYYIFSDGEHSRRTYLRLELLDEAML